jgi:hypothetical protein
MSLGQDRDGADLGPGPRSKVRRTADRARYDRASIYSILDEGFVCHLGYVAADGHPVVVPTVYGRSGDVLYLHGAPANHALRTAAGGRVCVTVSLVDALVLARSAFHHSVNYRSVMAFGTASNVGDIEEKRRALATIVDHVLAGRSHEARPPSDRELYATRVVRFDIAEASAKIRAGGPKEEPDDLPSESIWAGQVPVELAWGAPVPDDQAPVRAPVPPSVASLRPRGLG